MRTGHHFAVGGALFLAAFGMLLFAADAPALRYASPTGTSVSDCQTPVTACDLSTAVHGVPGNEPAAAEEVIVEPGTYKITAKVETGAPSMNVHGATGQPAPLVTGSVAQLLFISSGGRLADMDVDQSGSEEAVFATSATLERLRVIGTPSGDLLCQCYDGLIRDSVFIARPSSGTGVVGVLSNEGTSHETLRNVTIYSESKEAPAIELVQQGPKGALTLNAYNTIAINTQGGHDVSASKLATITMDHSDYASPVATGSGSVTDTGGHVSTPPLFVDGAGGDFRELAGSATVDAGLANEEDGPLDFEGNPRIIGTAPDIGAYEYRPPEPPMQAPRETGTPPLVGSPIPLARPVAPHITLAHLSRTSIRAARRGATIATRPVAIGATLSYHDSEAAVTTIRILRQETGHRSGRRCTAGRPRGHQRPCRRTRTVVTVKHADLAGANGLRLSGHGLRPGSYTLSLTPAANGLTGATVRLSFRIVR
jgi:hypothetical protein